MTNPDSIKIWKHVPGTPKGYTVSAFLQTPNKWILKCNDVTSNVDKSGRGNYGGVNKLVSCSSDEWIHHTDPRVDVDHKTS